MDWNQVVKMIVSLIGTIAVIDLVAIFLESIHSIAKLRGDNNRWIRVIFYGVVGGLFGIYATISGYTMQSGAIVTIRDVGAMMAGFMGGPIGGLIAGVIAGTHRLLVGLPDVTVGTSIPCAIATVLIGLLSGLLSKSIRKTKHQALWAMLSGAGFEVMHLLIAFGYLCIIEPVSDAWSTISKLTIYLILSNAIAYGVLIYVQNYIRKLRKNEAHTKQIESELNVAYNIQDSMLPKIFPDFPGRKEFSIFASMEPAKEVGGDFYDFFFVDDDHFAFLIADVSGKGVPAALFMVIAKTLIKSCVQSKDSLALAMTKANIKLLEGNEQHMFVTCWIGVLEISTNKLTYVNCGHNPPLICSNNEPFVYLRKYSGLVLAGSDKTVYKQYEMQLNNDDRIFLYTDGITEAMNINKEQYGEDRLIKLVNDMDKKLHPNDAINLIGDDVKKFINGIEHSDDMTMLALKINNCERPLLVEAKTENFEKVASYMEDKLNKNSVPIEVVNKMDIVLDELFSNVVKYSGSNDLEFVVNTDGTTIEMELKYKGTLFDITKSEEPDINAPIKDRKIGGLGLLIVRKICDTVIYKADGEYNIVTVTKKYK